MAMPDAAATPGTHPTHSTSSASMTLRALLDKRRSEGRRMSLQEAIAILVPVCVDLEDRHTRGERRYVHPAAIAPGQDGVARLEPRLAGVPTTTFDRHCLSPELHRTLQPPD